MSYARLGSLIGWPPTTDGALAASSNVTLDSSGEKFCLIFRVPQSGTLDGFEIQLGTVTQAPASGLRFSFQDCDTSVVPAIPDGTQDQYSDVTSGITSSAWLASGTMSRSVTRGDLLACVIEFVSFAASDSVVILRTAGFEVVIDSEYSGNQVGGTWGMSGSRPLFALRYSGGVYVPILGQLPWTAQALTAIGGINSGSTPDEYAMKIVAPHGAKTCGFVAYSDIDAATDVVLYDSGGTALATKSLVSNQRINNATVRISGFWDSDVVLTSGATYYLAIKPTSGSNIAVRYWAVNAAAIMAAAPGGSAYTYATRTDAGAWTETTTRRLAAQLIISDIDVGGLAPQMRITGPRPIARR